MRSKRFLSHLALQWSHAFSDVETACLRIRPCQARGFNGATPSQTWKPLIGFHSMPNGHSFNGATPSQTWKPRYAFQRCLSKEKLQWSHAFSDVETVLNTGFYSGASPLQWSHAFSDVETPVGLGPLSLSDRLQWSHAFSDVETMSRKQSAGLPPGASMEPRLLRRGNLIQHRAIAH